jgi:hypothetical protein
MQSAGGTLVALNQIIKEFDVFVGQWKARGADI